MTDELLRLFGAASLTSVLVLLGQYLLRRALDHHLQRDIESYKQALASLTNKLDFLHQERGKASLAILRQIKIAKMHTKLLVDPMQMGPVDLEKACQDAHRACRKLQNLIAIASFLFPEPIEELLIKTRTELWSLLDQATLLLRHSKDQGKEPRSNYDFCQLWKKLRTDFDPLETTLTDHIRQMLGVSNEIPRRTSRDQ